MHTDQLHHLQALSARKGVTDLLPEWLQFWHWGWTDVRKHRTIPDEDRALFVTGSLSKWLAGQGIAVVRQIPGVETAVVGLMFGAGKPAGPWTVEGWGWKGSRHLCLPMDTDMLSALIAAATARLEEMQDKEKA